MSFGETKVVAKEMAEWQDVVEGALVPPLPSWQKN